MILFSYPKVGKTSLLTKLPGNYVILDFEKGTDFFDCNKINVNDMDTFVQLREEFISTKPQFDFIVIDTLTSLYSDLVNEMAVAQYNQEEKKNLPRNYEITRLQYGLGYSLKRECLKMVIKFFENYCKTLILVGHVADKALGGTGESSVKELDFEGKLKNILALKVDAISMLHRTKSNENTLTFVNSSGLIGGTRSAHLNNKSFVISQMDEEGNLTTHWDKIFI